MGGPDDTFLTPQDADWLADDAAAAVCAAVSSEGAGIFFVGGCVRNALMGKPSADVDLATEVLPEEIIRLAEAAGLRAVPTGIAHGTVTVVVDGRGFEVTTFRKDVATDGRRAVVAFTNEIVEDARRRDFTMNALYTTPDGKVIDPLGGLPDLHARQVRFIEDAAQRIREDYLRILRYFRFSAWYGNPKAGFDADTLAAIADNIDGLAQLSKERIGAEMKKLLAAPDPAPAVAVMEHLGVLSAILPGSDAKTLPLLLHMEDASGVSADPLTRLASLGGQDVTDHLRLSKAEATRLTETREAAQESQPLSEMAYRLGAGVARQAMVLRAAFTEREPDKDAEAQISTGAAAVFPITAKDLMPQYGGRALGEILAKLENDWIESDFALDRKALLERANIAP